MYQVNGWLVLRDSPEESEPARQEELDRAVHKLVDAFEWPSGSVDLRTLNGETFLTVTCLTNHRGPEAADLERLLNVVSEYGHGSFGLFHEWDDESQDWPGPHAFKVRVVTRGLVTVREDPFFSPITPTIEDL
jgi:immunity protein 7 of polymorphic toxin system